jgi:hypothetical protein
MDEKELQQQLAGRFKELPKSVQQAILSSDIEGHLRALAETHKLHLDQWALLENEVMLTLLGFEQAEDLAKNIAHEVGVQEDVAEALAADVSKVVFAPIHAALEQKIPDPVAVETAEKAIEVREPAPASVPAAPEVTTAVEKTTPETTTPSDPPKTQPTPVTAATPPAPAPEKKVERAPISASYGGSLPSHERPTIEGDPYREQIA